MQIEEQNYRDPTHSTVEVNGFLFCIGGIRKFGTGVSKQVLRYVDSKLKAV